MSIELDYVVPAPLRDVKNLDSEIWGTRVLLDCPGFYQLWAPSGRGKTTFVHLIYGLRRDYTGTLTICRKRASSLVADDWAVLRQSSLSIVFQDLRLFPDLTAWENICIKHKLKPFQPESELRELCHELSIGGVLHKRCNQISFGEQQRVAVVRAMAQPFQWLLLDEPFSHLDADNVDKVCRVITGQCQLRNAGCLLMSLEKKTSIEHFHTLRL